MARKFIGEREHAFIDRRNKELLQRFVGVEILYYAVSPELTEVHDVYGETEEITHLPPVVLNGLVKYDNPGVTSNQFTLDSKYTLEVALHPLELQERSLQPRDGDFVEWNQIFWEVSSVTTPRYVFGQPQHKIYTRLVCIPTREGIFKNGGRAGTVDQVDNSHPAVNRPARILEE
jgi:hypothetical protein